MLDLVISQMKKKVKVFSKFRGECLHILYREPTASGPYGGSRKKKKYF
jgi:hypothetical protein